MVGYDLSANNSVAQSATDTITVGADGVITVNTTLLAQDIKGYGGTVPLIIKVKDGVVVSTTALPNSETPAFFDKAQTLLHSWDGMHITEAHTKQVDAVSGATLSSRAIMENARRGFAFVMAHPTETSLYDHLDLSAKNICALIVMLMATIIPLVWRNRKMRTIQLLLNVGVVGVWCATFLSHSLFISLLSGGIDPLRSIVIVLMLVVAFIFPLFGKKNFYCTNVCPLGAAQELMGRIPCRKLAPTPSIVKWLQIIRRTLWLILMLLLITDVWGEWIHYEPFSAFAFHSAELIAIIIALIALATSIFVPRAYCRFLCPTGTLLKLAQGELNKVV